MSSNASVSYVHISDPNLLCRPFKAPLDKPVIASEQDGPQRGDFDASAALAACIRELGLKVGDEMKDVPYRLCSQHKPVRFLFI